MNNLANGREGLFLEEFDRYKLRYILFKNTWNTLTLEIEPMIDEVEINSDELVVNLADGRRLMVPLTWFPRLWHGTAAERNNWQLLGGGYAIEWPDLDEHIGVEGLLAGRHSAESGKSLERWLKTRE